MVLECFINLLCITFGEIFLDLNFLDYFILNVFLIFILLIFILLIFNFFKSL
jgi:hypothetical protein